MNDMKPAPDSVNAYLQAIGRIPRLTHEQEFVYSNQVQRLEKLHREKEKFACRLEREISFAEWSTHLNLSEQELQSAIALGESAKRKMIEANLRLVVSVPLAHAPRVR